MPPTPTATVTLTRTNVRDLWVAAATAYYKKHPEKMYPALAGMEAMSAVSRSKWKDVVPVAHYQAIGLGMSALMKETLKGKVSWDTIYARTMSDRADALMFDFATGLTQAAPDLLFAFLGKRAGEGMKGELFKTALEAKPFPLNLVATSQDLVYDLIGGQSRVQARQRFDGNLKETLGDFYDSCLGNAKCDQAADAAIPELYDSHDGILDEMVSLAKLTPGRIVTKKPEMFPPAIRDGVKPDGTVVVTMGPIELVNYGVSFLSERTDLSFGIGEEFAADVDKMMADMERWVDLPPSAPERVNANKQLEEIYKQVSDALGAADAVLYGVTSIIGVSDPELARNVEAIGTSVIDTAGAALDLVTYAVQIGTGAVTANPIGVITATANFVGAAMGIFTAVNGIKPPPDPVVEQVKAVRADLERLGQHLDDRFDRIDAALGAIYQTVVTEMGAIRWDTATIKVDVERIRQTLAKQEVAMRRLEDRITAFAKTESRRPLRAAIDEGVPYRERKRQPMPLRPTFEHVTDVYHQYAVEFAYDDIETGLKTPDEVARIFDEDNLYRELQVVPLHENVHTINVYLGARGWPQLFATSSTGKDAPNPFTWAVAANAYAQVINDWPDHARALLRPENTEDIAVGGRKLRAALAKGATSEALFEKLIEHYSAKAGQLADALAAGAESWISAFREELGHSSEAPMLDLWADENQSLDYGPPGFGTIGDNSLPTPAALLGSAPQVAVNRDWLAGANEGLLQCSLKEAISDKRQVDTDSHGRPEWAGKLSVVVTLAYGETVLARRKTALGVEWLGGNTPTAASVWDEYETLLDKPDAEIKLNPTEEAKAAALRAELPAEVRKLIGERRAAFYSSLSELLEVETDDDDSPAKLARRLSGARLLLASVVSLCLSRAYEGDDALRAALEGPSPAAGGLGIPDADAYREALKGFASREPGGDSELPKDIHAWALTLAATATQPLSATISTWQGKIKSGEHQEGSPLIERALMRLDFVKLLYQTEQEDVVPQLPPVSQGETGPKVRRVQALLRAALPDLTNATLSINGTFNTQTTSALKRLQRKSRLPETGTVDMRTWRALLGLPLGGA